jgi:uncharacterized membrane protein YedE/YeeE
VRAIRIVLGVLAGAVVLWVLMPFQAARIDGRLLDPRTWRHEQWHSFAQGLGGVCFSLWFTLWWERKRKR